MATPANIPGTTDSHTEDRDQARRRERAKDRACIVAAPLNPERPAVRLASRQ